MNKKKNTVTDEKKTKKSTKSTKSTKNKTKNKLLTELKNLKKENENLKDSHLRIRAELNNIKKRTEREVFRIKENAYAVQFHPEMNEKLIKSWVIIHHEKLVQLNPDLPQKILTDTKLYLNHLEKFGKHMIETLCDRID